MWVRSALDGTWLCMLKSLAGASALAVAFAGSKQA